MKLFQKLAAIQIEPAKTPKREAVKLFARAVKNHQGFSARIKEARKFAINAGFDFLLARPAFEQGEWLQQCQLYAAQVSERSIQRYMQLAELSWRWAIYKNPNVKDVEKIRELAIDMVLVSPKPIVELCRELGHVLKFGGYFEDDYQNKKRDKLLGDGQIEFDFDIAEQALQMFCNPKVALPAELEKAEELAGTLKSAALRAERHLRELRNTVEAK